MTERQLRAWLKIKLENLAHTTTREAVKTADLLRKLHALVDEAGYGWSHVTSGKGKTPRKSRAV